MKNNHYKEVIENLHLEILHQYSSVYEFCMEFGYSRHNLSRIFNHKQKMSIGLFMRISYRLKLVSEEPPNDRAYNMNLQEYLQINHSSVMVTVMNIYTS